MGLGKEAATLEFVEINFDGLVGPTHHYGGLSKGNLASEKHQSQVSHPRSAALQGLSKMETLASLGAMQAFLPPLPRPSLETLRQLGFRGTDHEILARVLDEDPRLLSQVSSASNMWTANAATVSPSLDTSDGKTHFTAANLNQKFHRQIEAGETSKILKQYFPERTGRFAHHPPLPSTSLFGDEGAANHNRFCPDHGQKGLQLFVYGRDGEQKLEGKFPIRQSLQASKAIARQHGLDQHQVVFWQQNPLAIESGAFHNDVVCVVDKRTIFFHQKAFLDTPALVTQLKNKFAALSSEALEFWEVPQEKVSLEEAVETYLFNSQLVSLPDKTRVLVAPKQCETHPRVKAYLDEVLKLSSRPFDKVIYFNLKESMQNGGGPACLRLRVVLAQEDLGHLPKKCFATPENLKFLKDWIQSFYPQDLTLKDLADATLYRKLQEGYDVLSKFMDLPQV